MDKAKIKNYYDTVFNDKASRYCRLMEILPEKIEKSWRVLDYGTGTGLLAEWLSNTYGVTVDAVDISERELDQARSVWEDSLVNYFTMDKLSNQKYDMVFSIQVMEHVHNHGEYLNRINKMISMGGYFIVSIPNISNFRFMLSTIAINDDKLHNLSKHILNDYDKGVDHIHGWDPQTFVSLVSSSGFEFEKWTPTEGMAFPFSFPKSYINLMNKSKLGNLSYTMAFRFKKVRDVIWDIDA